MIDTPHTFGGRLRHVREQQGLTQEGLAQRARSPNLLSLGSSVGMSSRVSALSNSSRRRWA